MKVLMFTVRDEQLYQRRLEVMAERGATLDDVLRDLLDQAPAEQTLTPAQRLRQLIDAADLEFPNAFDAREAGDILRREAGAGDWRSEADDGTQ